MDFIYSERAPKKIFTVPLIGIDNYERNQPGAGIAMKYARPSATLTIYLFKGGLPSVPNDIPLSTLYKILEMSVEDIRNAVKNGIYSSVEIQGEKFLDCIKDSVSSNFLIQRFKVTNLQKLKRDSLILIGVVKNCFIKVRYTSDYVSNQSFDILRSEIVRYFNPFAICKT